MEKGHFKIGFENIEIIEDYFPEDTINAAFIEEKFSWNFAFNYGIKHLSKDSKDVLIRLTFKMVEMGNAENVILNLVTYSVININIIGKYSEKSKVEIIKRLISICLWSTRGAFAAKVENTAYAKILPTEISADIFEQHIINHLQDEWE